MSEPQTFDQLFESMVFNKNNNEQDDKILSTSEAENFLDGLLGQALFNQDPMIGNSISTPDIEYPLPEIFFKVEDDAVKEEVSSPFDIPTVIKEEPKEEPDPIVEKEDDESDDWTPNLVTPKSRKRKIKPEVLLKHDNHNSGKKKKLYEFKPFTDPVKERNRQNAINAKINRERKKKEKDALTKQMDLLRAENQKLRAQIKAKDKILKKHGLLKWRNLKKQLKSATNGKCFKWDWSEDDWELASTRNLRGCEKKRIKPSVYKT